MSMLTWAEKEVSIACARERGDNPSGEWDYGCACYESALKAYKSLIEDKHSGCSWSITRSILMRLMEGKPLTPIEDTPDIWNEVGNLSEDHITYQCKRKSSLFKVIYSDGTVKYNDVDRVLGIAEDGIVPYHNGLLDRIIGEMYPITMPYCPENKPYMVHTREFLTDPKNGDYDTVRIEYVDCPDGSRKYIERYFAYIDGKEVEINKYEYGRRVKLHHKRVQEEHTYE